MDISILTIVWQIINFLVVMVIITGIPLLIFLIIKKLKKIDELEKKIDQLLEKTS